MSYTAWMTSLQLAHPIPEIILAVSNALGVPLAANKVAGSTLALEFLGIVLDTHRMEARLPIEKTSEHPAGGLRMAKEKECKEKRHIIISGHSPAGFKGGQTR